MHFFKFYIAKFENIKNIRFKLKLLKIKQNVYIKKIKIAGVGYVV